jgi:flagellar basal body-associated protein FliL
MMIMIIIIVVVVFIIVIVIIIIIIISLSSTRCHYSTQQKGGNATSHPGWSQHNFSYNHGNFIQLAFYRFTDISIS